MSTRPLCAVVAGIIGLEDPMIQGCRAQEEGEGTKDGAVFLNVWAF